MNKEFVIAGVSLLLLISSGFGQSEMKKAAGPKSKTVSQSPPDNLIIAREKEVWEVVKNRQLDKYRTYYASNFSAVYSDGVKSHDQEAEGVLKVELKSYALSETKVVFPNRDTPVLTYKVTVQGNYQGQDISGSYYCSSVWVKDGGKWLAALHTEVKAE